MFTLDYQKLPHLSFDKTTDSIQEYDYYTSWNSRMTLDAFFLKNLPFVSATFHCSSCGFAPEANVAAISQPKMVYLDVE